MIMRDPVLYRIRHAHHYRRGDTWCIYPLYDYAHCLEDAFEGVTHSVCTLEFENNREIYDWLLDNVGLRGAAHAPVRVQPAEPRVHRRLQAEAHSAGQVGAICRDGTIRACPRWPASAAGACPPRPIRRFVDMIGVAKTESWVDPGKLEYAVRDVLNQSAPEGAGRARSAQGRDHQRGRGCARGARRALLPPRRPAGGLAYAALHAGAVDRAGRLLRGPAQGLPAPGSGRRGSPPLRLRHPLRRGGQGRRRAGWWSCAAPTTPTPAAATGATPGRASAPCTGSPCPTRWTARSASTTGCSRCPTRRTCPRAGTCSDNLNPESLVVLAGAKVEPSVLADDPETRYQFERTGYFWRDPVDGRGERLVFNRIVDAQGHLVAAGGRATPSRQRRSAPGRRSRYADAARAQGVHRAPRVSEERAAVREAGRGPRRAGWPATRASWTSTLEHADVLTGSREACGLLRSGARGARRSGGRGELGGQRSARRARRTHQSAELPFGGAELGRLARMVDEGHVSRRAAKDVLAEMADSGGRARGDRRAAWAWRRSRTTTRLSPVVDMVIAAWPEQGEGVQGRATAGSWGSSSARS